MISSLGVGSGLDINSIVSQLMAIERRPLTTLQRKESDFEAQLSAYGRLKSSVSDFQTAMQKLSSTSKFQLYSATSADETLFTATADSTAGVGAFSIEVVNLAVSQKMASAAFADSTTTTIGNAGDTVDIQVGSDPANTFTVDIGGKTLNQIRDAINVATDNKGVTASVLNENGGYRLVLTSNDTGTANQMTLSFKDSGSNPIADPLTTTTIRNAEDAQIKVDGFTATRSSNTISDVIQGVTLTLKGESTPGATTDLSVGRDDTAVTDAVQEFVDTFNSLRSTISDLRSGDLEGDNTLLSIESRLLSVINSPASGLSGAFKYLSEVGVSIQKNGDMALDTAQLDTAMQADFPGFADLFGNQGQGFAYRLNAFADDLLASNGLLKIRTDGINDRIDFVQSRQDQLERRLVTVEDRLRAQFTAMDALVGQLNSTGDYLNRQLANLTTTR